MANGAADWARPLATSAAIRRGDRKRRRAITARYFGGLSAAGLVAAAVLAVTALVPSAPSAPGAGHQPTAGLQRTLRADGVPASVIFYPSKLPDGVPFSQLFNVPGNPCHPFSGGQGQ